MATKEARDRASKNYYLNHKEKIQAYRKQYNAINKDTISQKHKIFREQHKEIFRQRSKDYYYSHKEHCLEQKRLWKIANKERIDIQDKLYRDSHKSEIAERGRQWRVAHKEQIFIAAKARYIANRDKIRVQEKNYRESHKLERSKIQSLRNYKLRIEVISHYGNGKCACVRCGGDDMRTLSIDHINGGGNKHRKVIGTGGAHLYSWLKNNHYPEGYQTLCMNCQFIKRLENHESKHNENNETYLPTYPSRALPEGSPTNQLA